MTEIKRLKYTDSTGTEQVLGALKTPIDQVPNSPDATAKIKNIKVSRTPRGFNTAKIWATSQLYGELPVAASDFNSSEPEIFLQYYDRDTGNWVDEMRLYAENQGGINGDGEVAVKLYTHAKRTGNQNANKTSATTTNIVDGFDSVLPSGYTAVAPAEADIDGSYPNLEDYTLVDKRRTGYRELTKDHDWFYRFTPVTDNNGDYEVFIAPMGWEGPVDTIQSKQDFQDGNVFAKKIKEWEKGRTKDIVNSVEVVGKNADGAKITATASDSASINDYGERFERFQIDYRLGSASEAENLAQDKLQLSPGEGGEIKVESILDSVVGKTYNVKDSVRSIDGEFTVTEQVNFYPENNTKLTFTYESEIEKRAEKDDNIGSERNKIYPSTQSTSTTEVVGPDVLNSSGSDQPSVINSSGNEQPSVINNSGSDSPDVENNSGSDSPNVENNSGFQGSNVVNATSGAGGASVIQSTAEQGLFESLSGSGWEQFDTGEVSAGSDNSAGATLYFTMSFEYPFVPTTFGEITQFVDVRVTDDSGSEYPSFGGVTYLLSHMPIDEDADGDPDNITQSQVHGSIEIPEDTAFRDYSLEIDARGTDYDVSGGMVLAVYDEHSHTAGQLEADSHYHGSGTYSADNHDHDDGTYSASNHSHNSGTYSADNHGHGSGTYSADNHDHDNGTYTAEDHEHGDIEVDAAEEDKTDR